jgi:hypothetical protein
MRFDKVEGFDDQLAGASNRFNGLRCFQANFLFLRVVLWLGYGGFVHAAFFIFFPASTRARIVPTDFGASDWLVHP